MARLSSVIALSALASACAVGPNFESPAAPPVSSYASPGDAPAPAGVLLTPSATGTRVRVTHSGLANEPISRKDYGQGWDGVLHLLQTYLQRQSASQACITNRLACW